MTPWRCVVCSLGLWKTTAFVADLISISNFQVGEDTQVEAPTIIIYIGALTLSCNLPSLFHVTARTYRQAIKEMLRIHNSLKITLFIFRRAASASGRLI